MRPLSGIAKSKICAVAAFAALLASFSAQVPAIRSPQPAHAAEAPNVFGELQSYNIIARGDFSAGQADSEGAVAVGGNMHAPFLPGQSYSVGASNPLFPGQNNSVGGPFDPDSAPALLLGGTHTNSGTNLISLGNVTLPTGVSTDDMDIHGDTNFRDQSAIRAHIDAMISQADAFLTDALSLTPAATIDGGNGWNTSPMSFHLAVENPRITLGVFDSDTAVTIGEIYVPDNTLDQQQLVVYSAAETINFVEGGYIFNGEIVNTNRPFDPDSNFVQAAQRVVYYFPNATEINFTRHATVGSVFAPKAAFSGDGGAINGQAIFDSVYQENGFEFHNFPFSWGSDPVIPFDGSVSITKVDGADPSVLLEGAEFELTHVDTGESVVMVTDGAGFASVTGLPYGTYRLEELVAPEGYILNFDPVTFELDELTHQFEFEIENVTAPVGPDILGRIEILKVDSVSAEPLAGAVYRLTHIPSSTVSEHTSTAEGTVLADELPLGLYRIEEIVAPPGYELDDTPREFTLTESLHVIEYTHENVAIAPEPAPLGSVLLEKVDQLNPAIKLAGAEFDLVYVPTDITRTLVSGEDGKAFAVNLDFGEYRLEEVRAPDGYAISFEPVTFVLTADAPTFQIVAENVRDEPLEPTPEPTPEPAEPTEPPAQPDPPTGHNEDASSQNTIANTGAPSDFAGLVFGVGILLLGLVLSTRRLTPGQRTKL